jgi:surface protein
MFNSAGRSSQTFTLDVSSFDTSKVTDMSGMFNMTGYSNQNFTLDVSSFDTSQVTDMSGMFYSTGRSSTTFTLDVSNFDTSKVTNMSSMFNSTGYSNKSFTLDVSNFDTSQVTDMYAMFYSTGYQSTTFTLDISNFDTSNVTNMSSMFHFTGYSCKTFTLDISNFDTSKVTNMRTMFYNTGYNSTVLDISITIRNSKVTSYSNMFTGVATKTGSKITVNYTTETSNLVDLMIATKSSSSNVVKGNLIIDFTGLDIGDEVVLESEKFNVISQNNENITLLAQYNLDSNILQSSTEKPGAFSNSADWEYQPGPKEIDIYQNYGFTQSQLAGYVGYLRQITKNYSISGNLISLQDLKSLGCTISEDYSTGEGFTCAQSPYKSWLVNNQWWWTRSASSSTSSKVWLMQSDGTLVDYSYYYYRNHGAGTRPVITKSKNPSNPNEIVSFEIDDTVYNAYENMTWKEWVNSDFNTGDFKIATCSCETGCYDDNDGEYIYSPNSPELVIVDPNNIKINSNDKVSWYDIYTLRKYTYSPTGSLIC